MIKIEVTVAPEEASNPASISLPASVGSAEIKKYRKRKNTALDTQEKIKAKR